eukprot:s2935_g8.t3
MKTLEAEPQRICVVTGGPLAEELQEAANEPGVFDKVLYFDPVVSCLRSGIAQVLQTLPPESLVLVYIAGHGVQTESHTLIVPEDAEDWSGSLSLEHEFASQIASQKRRTSHLTICCIYVGLLLSWKTCVLSRGGLKRPPELPRISWCETDGFLTFYACPRHTMCPDCSMVGPAAHLLRFHPDSLQSYLLMLKDEIRYMSLAHLEPDFWNGDILNARSVSMYRGSSLPSFQPIMVDSVLDSFVHAPLLRQHLFVLIRNELNKGLGYSATRKTIVDLGKTVKAVSQSLADVSWLASTEVQLQGLRQSSLAGVARVLGNYAQAAYGLPSKAQMTLQTVSCETRECIISALQDDWAMHEGTAEIGTYISGLLGLLCKPLFRRQVISPGDLFAGGPGLDWEYVLLPGQEPAALSTEEKNGFTTTVQELLSRLSSTKSQPPSRILLARGSGSLWLMIACRLSEPDTQLFQRKLQEYILDRKFSAPVKKHWLGSFSIVLPPSGQVIWLDLYGPPKFTAFAMVPLGTNNLVTLAGALLAKTAPSNEACWLQVAGFKKLVKTWIDQVGHDGDWHIQLLRLGRPLDDDEWLQSASNLRIVAEPTWTSLRADESLQGILLVLQQLSKREVDGVEWVATQSFEHLVSTSLSLVFAAKFLHEPLCEILRGEQARECREPRSLHELLWKELLRRCATFPYEEEPAAPVGAGYLKPSAQPCASHPAAPLWDEVTTLVLEQLWRFAASRVCFLKLLQVKEFRHAEAYSEFVEVLRGLSEPVATRGSSSHDIDNEIDRELSQTLQNLSDDIGSVGVEQAISRFVEEWN